MNKHELFYKSYKQTNQETKQKKKTKKSFYANFIHNRNLDKIKQWLNADKENHVSVNDLSKGGLPYHFAGYKKG